MELSSYDLYEKREQKSVLEKISYKYLTRIELHN